MCFDWSEYLRLAEQLAAEAEAGELLQARRRTAVSRAYYAAFHSTMGLLKSRGEYAPQGDGWDHEGVVRTCSQSSSRGWHPIGNDLRRLRRQRVNADYKAAMEVSDSLVQSAVERARDLIDRLKRV